MSSSHLDVLEEVRRILVEEVGLSPDRPVARESRLVADLGLDSMTLITLAVALEDRFRVLLSDAEAAEVATVGELAALVAARRTAAS